VERNLAEPEAHADHQEGHPGEQRLEVELAVAHPLAGLEEVERHEERGERLDRAEHPLGGHGGEALPELARGDAHQERAHQVVDPEPPGGRGADHGHHQQEGELRPRRVRRDPRGEPAEERRQDHDEPDQRQQAEPQLLGRGGLQGEEHHQQGEQFGGDGLRLRPAFLRGRQPEQLERIEDESRGRGEQGQRHQRGLAGGQREHIHARDREQGQGDGPDREVLGQDPGVGSEFLDVHVEPGEQEQRHDAEGRQQGDGLVVLEQAKGRGRDPEAQAGDGSGEPVALEEPRHDEQHEQQDHVRQVSGHWSADSMMMSCHSRLAAAERRLPWTSATDHTPPRRSALRPPSRGPGAGRWR